MHAPFSSLRSNLTSGGELLGIKIESGGDGDSRAGLGRRGMGIAYYVYIAEEYPVNTLGQLLT